MKKIKFFRRFNIIDVLAAVFLIVAILISFYYYTNEDGLFKKQQFEIEYIIRIDKIENEFLGNLSHNDTLYDFSNVFPIGEISDIRTYPNDQYYSAMEIVVDAIAEIHNGVISVNGIDIFTGKWIEFRTPNIVHGGSCIAIMINDSLDGAK